MELVSVVIPVYNADRYLAAAIDSVLGQTYVPSELIVVDDGSTDASSQIAAGYGGAITHLRQERGGQGVARNLGVERSHGEFISFLDADDFWHATKLERECQVLVDQPELSVVRSLVHEFVSPELDEASRQNIRETHDAIPGILHYGTMRREAFEVLGGFATDIQLAVGVDFSARFADSGLGVGLVNEVLVERRLHESNNWTREASRHSDLAMAVKASLDRRRKAAGTEA